MRIEISEEEICKAIKNLKKKKAVGEDGTKSEAWIEGGEKVMKVLTRELKKISKGGCDTKWVEKRGCRAGI